MVVFVPFSHFYAAHNWTERLAQPVSLVSSRGSILPTLPAATLLLVAYAPWACCRYMPYICANCPSRELCTHSTACVKTVQRHVWKDYEELADDARYTPEYRDLYKKRKETIERVFADAKEKHAMRYTQYRGLTQVTNWVKLKFAAMNLKKLARWKWKDSAHFLFSLLSSRIYAENPAAA